MRLVFVLLMKKYVGGCVLWMIVSSGGCVICCRKCRLSLVVLFVCYSMLEK